MIFKLSTVLAFCYAVEVVIVAANNIVVDWVALFVCTLLYDFLSFHKPCLFPLVG